MVTLTNGSYVAPSNLVVSKLRYETGFTNPTVSTQEYFEQVIVVTVHMTHY